MSVTEIVLEGPGRNSLSTPLMTELLRRLRAAAGGPVLLTGAGQAFCAGLDLKEILGLDPAGMAAYLDLLDEVVDTLWTWPGPVVAAVNGHAIAGGAILTLAADHRVLTTAPGARVGLTELALGLEFPPLALAVVQDRLPRRAWERAVLGAEVFAPVDALALGFVDELADDPAAVARARLGLLASRAPGAYATTKAALRRRVQVTRAEQGDFRRRSLPLWTSDPVKAAIRALLKL